MQIMTEMMTSKDLTLTYLTSKRYYLSNTCTTWNENIYITLSLCFISYDCLKNLPCVGIIMFSTFPCSPLGVLTSLRLRSHEAWPVVFNDTLFLFPNIDVVTKKIKSWCKHSHFIIIIFMGLHLNTQIHFISYSTLFSVQR